MTQESRYNIFSQVIGIVKDNYIFIDQKLSREGVNLEIGI